MARDRLDLGVVLVTYRTKLLVARAELVLDELACHVLELSEMVKHELRRA